MCLATGGGLDTGALASEAGFKAEGSFEKKLIEKNGKNNMSNCLQTVSEYIKDLNEKNIERLMKKVADDVIFWPFKDKEILGKDQYRKFHENLFQNVPLLKIEYKIRQEDVGGHLAFFALDCAAYTSKEQNNPEYSRVSLIFKKNKDEWRIIHDHYSQRQEDKRF